MPAAALWRRWTSAAWTALALATPGLCPPAHATSLQITPVRVDLPAGPGAAALTLRNADSKPIHAQVRVFRWSQADGDDVLAPTDEVLASPPIIRIAGNGEQLIRVVRPEPGASAGEAAYRLLIDELPLRDAPPSPSGVRVQLRYSVPVFAGTPAGPPAARLAVSLWRDQGQWRLSARNDGERHARLSDVVLVSASQRIRVAEGLFGYALPGATRVWDIRLPAAFTPGADVRLDAAINGEPASLPVTQRQPDRQPDPGP